MKPIKIILLPFILFACQSPQVQDNSALLEELELCKLDNGILTNMVDSIRIDEPGTLMHVVYFKMKDGLNAEQMKEAISTLESLKQIEEVKTLEVGDLGDTGDARAGSTEGLVLQMAFESLDDLASYQKNEYHLAQRAKLKDFFGGPPV
ncbi:MAG: Dabb family protein, partial [Bacteroidota bacterium]